MATKKEAPQKTGTTKAKAPVKKVSKKTGKPTPKTEIAASPSASLITQVQTSLEDNFRPNTVKQGSLVLDDKVSDWFNLTPTSSPNPEAVEKQLNKNKMVARISLDENIFAESEISLGPLAPTDRLVLEAVLSQLRAGNDQFTSAMLFRTMTGKDTSATVTKTQVKMVDAAMRKMMFAPISIELGQTKEGASAKLSGALIPAEVLEIKVSGRKCTAYAINSPPLIYKYCVATNSIATMPLDVLSIPNMSYTERNLAIINILERYVVPILYPVNRKYKIHKPINILYEEFYAAVEALQDQQNGEGASENLNPTIAKRVRDTIHSILDSWVDRDYIKRWEVVLGNRGARIGVRIFFNSSEPPTLPPQDVSPSKYIDG